MVEEGSGTPLQYFSWKVLWTEEPSRLQSMGSLRVRYDWATSLSLLLSCIGEGNSNPLQCSCLENPRDGGAWWAAVYGVTQSQTWLKWLSSSSRQMILGPTLIGFLGGASGKKNLPANAEDKRCQFNPWVGKMSWRRKWKPTPVFLPWKFHGKRSLDGYGP